MDSPLRRHANTAVVTGAAGGLGSAFATELVNHGFDLVLVDRDVAKLEGVAAAMVGRARVETLVLDLADEAALRSLVAQLSAREDVALLVNCAGVGSFSYFWESTRDHARAMVNVNVLAGLDLASAVLPQMRVRGFGGIINVASAGAFWRFRRDAVYSGGKAFLVAFTEILALELRGSGVAVQALAPAWLDTEFQAAPDYVEAGAESAVPSIPRALKLKPTFVARESLQRLGLRPITYTPGLRHKVARRALGLSLGRTAVEILRWARARSGR